MSYHSQEPERQDEASFPVSIRRPLNTHPSQLGIQSAYGATDDVNSDSYYYSAMESYDGSSLSNLSIRDHIESFVGAYSHASALYMAENVNVPNRYHELTDDELESSVIQEYDEHNMKAKLLPIDLTQTISQHGQHLQYLTGLSRHSTVASVISQQLPQKVTKSTFVQSVFNSVNVLVGIGILTLPLAFRCAGWLFGSLIFLFCALATNYTAKVIAKCLDFLPSSSSTYGDMSAAAFGSHGRAFVSVIFVTELMTIGVAMVVLLGDAIESLFPDLDMISIRIGSFFVLTPMLFLPIRKLAYTSLMGIISCFCLLFIVLYDGLSKAEKPGSLLDPMDTEIIPSDLNSVPLCIGLIMAGFSGHAVFPAIYRDMQNPKSYERMVDLTYVITIAIYATMAVAGYAMFGSETMQEITQNLASTPGYSTWVNRFAIWLIVLTPIAKYGLMMNPVTMTWELWAKSFSSVDTLSSFKRHAVSAFGKTIISLLVVVIATLFPGFDRVMSLLGALFSFGISAIFPLVCYIKLFHAEIPTKESILIYLILSISILMAFTGTLWSFLPH